MGRVSWYARWALRKNWIQKLKLTKVPLFISTEPIFILSTAGTDVLGLKETIVNKIGFALGKMSDKQINEEFQILYVIWSEVKSLRRVWLLVTPWAAAYQAPPSMGFSRQEYWSGVPLKEKANALKKSINGGVVRGCLALP